MKNISKEKLEEIKLHKHLAKKYYSIRERNPHYVFFNEKWIELLKEMLPAKKQFKNTLDLGCGTVEFYELVTQKLRSHYTGVDLSPDMLAMGKKKYPHIKLRQADAEKLPFKTKSFDLVIGRGIIHHLPNPKKGCEEAYRVLKKGGYFIVSEPHSNLILYWVRRVYYRVSSHFSDTHKSFFHNEFENLLAKSGFTIQKIRYWGILSFPFAFPDILPTYKYMPLLFFKLLVKIDSFLTKIPFIKSFAWHVVILCKK